MKKRVPMIGDAGAPPVLRRLEDRIDAVAGTWRWLPQRDEGRRLCFREDGSTEYLEIYSPDQLVLSGGWKLIRDTYNSDAPPAAPAAAPQAPPAG